MQRLVRLVAVLTVVALAIGLTLAGAGPAAAAVAAEPPIGLMIQVSTLAPTISPSTLHDWLEDVRRDHHAKAEPGYVNTLVLQDIADPAGALYTDYLDVLAPYLPGGATPVFTRVYVGTVDQSWAGGGSKYLEGIENPSFSAENIAVSRAAAAAFRARYPKVVNDWYVTYEANLAGFWDTTLATAYHDYLARLINALGDVRANRRVLWSPAFWTTYSAEPTWTRSLLASNLQRVFSALPTRLSLSIQDFVGQSGGASTPHDAVTWIRYLQRTLATRVTGVTVNVEQFTVSASGAIRSGASSDLAARETWYRSKGIGLGAAAEIRYWHTRLYG